MDLDLKKTATKLIQVMQKTVQVYARDVPWKKLLNKKSTCKES